ncbi:MAG: hypothetical protein WD398_03705 [Cyclobacteriaceae bacterium]
MKFLSKLLMAGGVCVFLSCSTTQPVFIDHSQSGIRNLQIFHPISHMAQGKKDYLYAPNNLLLQSSRNTLLDVLRDMKSSYPLDREMPSDSGYGQLVLEEDIRNLFDETAQNSNNLSQVNIPVTISGMLDQENQRFGLLSTSYGFTHFPNNSNDHFFKNIGLSVLSLGIYHPLSLRSENYLAVIIVDNLNGEVIYFNSSIKTDHEPLGKTEMTRQLEKLFDGVFEELQASGPFAWLE